MSDLGDSVIFKMLNIIVWTSNASKTKPNEMKVNINWMEVEWCHNTIPTQNTKCIALPFLNCCLELNDAVLTCMYVHKPDLHVPYLLNQMLQILLYFINQFLCGFCLRAIAIRERHLLNSDKTLCKYTVHLQKARSFNKSTVNWDAVN